MTNHNENLGINDYSHKIDGLKRDLDLIQEKYIDFFKSRGPRLPNQEHDTIHNHYLLIGHTNGVHEFCLSENSELPDYIKNECVAAHKKHFSSSKY